MLAFSEVYYGQKQYKKGNASAYNFSGTNVYLGGKYTSDGKYNGKVFDAQPGIYILISSILEK